MESDSTNKATNSVSGNDGTFAIKGLDDGTYYLQEKRKLEEFTVKALTNGLNWNGLTDSC